MATNAIMRPAAARRALAMLLAAALAAAALSACGGSGGTTTAVPEPAADAELLDHVLSRQLGAIEAYAAVMPGLGGRDLALAEKFRAQEQEHVDALVKALRGLGSKPEAEAEGISTEGIRGRAQRLGFLYELESATIDSELSAISKLTASWPRALLGSIVANQAQHLALLRRALGAKPLDAVPKAFEAGTTPAP